MNWNNKQIVRFADGTYGVRRGWIKHSFASRGIIGAWWSTSYNVHEYCKCKTFDEARQLYNDASISHTVLTDVG